MKQFMGALFIAAFVIFRRTGIFQPDPINLLLWCQSLWQDGKINLII